MKRMVGLLLLAIMAAGCMRQDEAGSWSFAPAQDATVKVVAHGKIMTVAVDGHYLLVDDVKDVFTQLGAAVDLNGADKLLTLAYSATDESPEECVPATADHSFTVVFNDRVIRTDYRDVEGRLFLPVQTFVSLCRAMGKRVSDPPYDDLIAVAPAQGEAISKAPEAAPVPALGGHGGGHGLPGKGGH